MADPLTSAQIEAIGEQVQRLEKALARIRDGEDPATAIASAALAASSAEPLTPPTRLEMLQSHLSIMRELQVRPEIIALVEREIAAETDAQAEQEKK
jgi:hypothetical protein